MVESELLKNEKHSEFTLEDNDLETFYECEIECLTKCTVLEYKYDKRGITDCWKVDCNKCMKECKYQVKGTKFVAVFYRK